MKKRLLSLLLFCGMVLTMVFTAAMAAPAHTHAYGDWTTDELSHRHVCTAPNCPDPAGSEQDLGAHSFTDGDGLICGVCGYTRTIPTPDVPRHNNHPLKWITLISGGRRFHSWSCMTCVDNLVNVPCYRDWTVLREADCTHDGLQARACQICGVESQVISAHHTLTWQSGGGQYWQACQKCDYTSAKQALPVLTITGADRVCATQDYTFTFTLPAGATNAEAGYEFPMLGSDVPVTVDNGVCTGTVEAEWYDQAAASFDVIASGKTADGFFFTARKTVALLSNHTGGTATCVQQAACDVCGAAYGDVDPARHAVLQRVAAQPATQEHEGNVEYWFCADCGKYFADADGKEEIDESDLVTEKLPPEAPETPKPDPDPKPAADAKAPQTDDAFHPALLLAAMALCAAAAVGTFLVPKRRKHDR